MRLAERKSFISVAGYRASLLMAGLCLLTGCSTVGLRSPLEPFERSKLYLPVRYPDGDWQPVGLAYEDAWFTAADGTKLHGWFVPCRDPSAVVLFAHGNSGNVTHLAEALREFCQRHRLSVMAFDYRGYGRSEGIPSEQGLMEDARAARAWLSLRTGVDERDIVLMGRSLGGGVAVAVAAEDGARGLILESTFTSVPAVARHHAPLLPAGLLMTNRFDSLAKIKEYHGPLLMSHGDADQIVPYRQGEWLFEAANPPKRFVTIHGGDHNDAQNDEYHQALDDFIASLPPTSSCREADTRD